MGIWDLVAGLPLHPLVVHVAVVLLPLSALGLIVVVLVPRARKPFAWLVLAGLAAGSIATFVAKQSGEALAARVGLPEEHAQWGDILPFVALALTVVAGVWVWLWFRQRGTRQTTTLTTLVGWVAILGALATIVLTVVVGHTGALAVWEGRIATTPVSAPADATQPSASGDLTMAEVARHDSADDCWSVVDGTVYDLTSWISQHPGGPSPIKGMCGVDASSAFRGQHGNQATPNKVLDGFALGPVAG